MCVYNKPNQSMVDEYKMSNTLKELCDYITDYNFLSDYQLSEIRKLSTDDKMILFDLYNRMIESIRQFMNE